MNVRGGIARTVHAPVRDAAAAHQIDVSDLPLAAVKVPSGPAQVPRRVRGRRSQFPLIFLVPAVVLLVAFHFAPDVEGIYYSFTNWDGLTPAKWIGLQNFHKLLTDSETSNALLNTLEVAFLFLILVNALGLGLAVGLHRAVKTRNALRALFYAPAIVSPLAVGLTWQYILTSNGALNQILGGLGLSSWERPWLADPTTAIWTVLAVLVWQYSGLAMIIYLAGLQGISNDLYEAAALDGASVFAQFRRISLPLLAPSVTICSTVTLVLGLRVFDQVMALTGGGPVDSSQTLATEVYKQTFVFGRYGYGSALAVALTLLISVLSFAQLAFLRRRESEM